MLAETGHFCLILAFFVAALQAAVGFTAAAHARRSAMGFAATAAWAQFLLIVGAFAALIALNVASDFSVLSVAANSHTDKPLLFKIAGTWGSHEGSMLLWALVLALYGAAAALEGAVSAPIRARMLAVQGALGAAFLLYILLTSDPFLRLDPAPLNGQGLNPLLQDVGLALHPPLTYLGSVGFAIVYALALSALISGRCDEGIVRALKRWSLIAWTALTLGTALGAWWSYDTLGWGGWWAWDPVENAALMPWLTATALLHALPLARRGALKAWTLFLALAVFAFSFLGTFLVRSGVLVSVHSFASDPTRGIFILLMLVLFVGGALTVFALRAGRLGDEVRIAPLSREGGLMIASLLLAAAAAMVAIGTLYPIFLEALGLGRISVGAPYFNTVFSWLSVPAMAALAAAPLLGRPDGLRRLGLPALAGAAAGLGFAFRYGFAWPALGLGLGVLALSAGASVRQSLAARIAHGGLALLLIGVAVCAGLESQTVFKLAPGGSTAFAGWHVTLDSVRPRRVENYLAERAELTLTAPGRTLTLTPERRRYDHPPMEKPVPAIATGPFADLYAVLGESAPDGATLQIFRRPLQSWIFAGMLLMALGGLCALAGRRAPADAPAPSPARARLAFRRRRSLLIPAAFLLLAAGFGARLIDADTGGGGGGGGDDRLRGSQVPDFALAPLDAGAAPLTDKTLRGRTTVITFFASWCAPCRTEAPAMKTLIAAGVPVYAIAYQDAPEATRAFLKETGLHYAAIGRDDTGRTAIAFGLTGVPESFVVDPDGRIRDHIQGALDPDMVHSRILPEIPREGAAK